MNGLGFKQSVRLSLVLVLITLVLLACKDKKNLKPFVVVTPDGISVEALVNTKLVFNIKVLSDEKLSRFQVTKKFVGESEVVLLDSALTTINFSYQWVYKAPAVAEEDFYLYFKATNETGYESLTGRRVTYVGRKYEEIPGLKMYSAGPNNPIAYDLLQMKPLKLNDSLTYADIKEFKSDTIFTFLSKEWVSPTGCRFVKLNDFDFINANSISVKKAFEVGIPKFSISEISLGDIYIIKIERAPAETYVVLKITNLVDKEGKAEDYYEFAIKK